ncbi:MAG: tRNA lysidine(34) synthetase TilS [bacterium]
MILAAGEPIEKSSPDKDRALFDYALLSRPLSIRNRRNGDRYYPSGLGGSKKVKDYFIDCKIPRSERDRIPLLTTADDEIMWIIGYRQDERFQVSAHTKKILVIEVRRER